MPKDLIEHWSDPEKRRAAREYIEKRLAELRQDKDIFSRKEHFSLEFDLEGLSLVQLKFVEVIFKELLENDESELLLYLIHKGLEYEMMKLGIARQALLVNVADMIGVDLPESDRIIES